MEVSKTLPTAALTCIQDPINISFIDNVQPHYLGGCLLQGICEQFYTAAYILSVVSPLVSLHKPNSPSKEDCGLEKITSFFCLDLPADTEVLKELREHINKLHAIQSHFHKSPPKRSWESTHKENIDSI